MNVLFMISEMKRNGTNGMERNGTEKNGKEKEKERKRNGIWDHLPEVLEMGFPSFTQTNVPFLEET